jgi:Mg2+ and Co2+ transporter CorA
MTFIDDNYLDGIITRMTAEHKANIMRTARRLNLPDDDVLFLYIGAVEYTVQLCEDILGGISSERQRLEQSTQETQKASIETAENLINSLTQVGLSVVANMQKAGMANTSAIASANAEVLNQSLTTVREAVQLQKLLMAWGERVEADSQNNQKVLQLLLERMGQSTKGLEKALSQINEANTALVKLQKNTTWIKVAQWFSPLTALLVAALVGFGSGWWVMSLKYNDSTNALGRNLVKWNIDRILKCREDDNSKCTIWVVPPPAQRK